MGRNVAYHHTGIAGLHEQASKAKYPRILNWIFVLMYQTLLLSFRIAALNQSFTESLYVLDEGLHILFEFQDPEVVPEENHQTCYSLYDSFLSRHCA